MPTISLCIPTYNRSRLLAELLDSVIAQDASDLEVIVSDDASPDDTFAVIEPYKARLPGLRYVRQPVNIGLDRNYLELSRLATGDFIWFMGDDDILEPGAVQTVADALQRWPDVGGLTLGVIDYAPDMSAPIGVRTMPQTGRLQGVEEVFGALADLLGFMSSLVVNRAMWNDVSAEPATDDFHNLYLQVYLTGRIVQKFGGWGVVNTPCVRFRSSNDQFLSKLGWLSRMKVDVVAYEQIAAALFADNRPAFWRMQKDILQAHIMARIRNAKTSPGPTPDVPAAALFLMQHYGPIPAFWHTALPNLLAPDAALRTAKRLYQRYSPRSGARRAAALRTTTD